MKIQASYGIFEIEQGIKHDEIEIKFRRCESSRQYAEIMVWLGFLPIELIYDCGFDYSRNLANFLKWFRVACEAREYQHKEQRHSLSGFFDLCWELSQCDKAIKGGE